MSDFQAKASHTGRSFEQFVVGALDFYGWTVTGQRVVIDGMEIDIVANDPSGVEWLIECKGSTGNRPGAQRSDTTKKAVGVAAHLRGGGEVRPYMLVTSHLPKPGSVSAQMLERAQALGWFDRVVSLGFGQADELIDDEVAS